jgi:HK97 gp10 family phage protein
MIDFEAIAREIFDQAAVALGQGGLAIQTRARQLAPVRGIASEATYEIRTKTWGEIEADRAIRSRLGLGPELKAGPKRAKTTLGAPIFVNRKPTGKNQPQHMPARQWGDRRIAAAEAHLADYLAASPAERRGGLTYLTRQGAYEVRTKRAKHLTWGHSHIGGRLRASIGATNVTRSGWTAEQWVISDVPYAKYQEFGTRHNAAHPFLRPALNESREEIISRIAAAVREASRTNGSSMDIEIVVRL